jgi:hypothetical protein
MPQPKWNVAALAATALAGLSGITSAGCATDRDAVPPGANVETLQTQSLVLRGTAPAHPGSASCASSSDAGDRHFLELTDDATMNVTLRPTRSVAVLHVAQLGTRKTWCVMTKGDGLGATIPADFPRGVYAISVLGSHVGESMPYAVAVERL